MTRARMVLTVMAAAGLLWACADALPAGLRDTYRYEARFATAQSPDTVRGRVRFTSAAGDSVFGIFEALDTDPDDAAQFGTEFPLTGRVSDVALEFTVAAPGLRIEHAGTRADGTITGTCSATVFDQPEPFPCTFRMWEP